MKTSEIVDRELLSLKKFRKNYKDLEDYEKVVIDKCFSLKKDEDNKLLNYLQMLREFNDLEEPFFEEFTNKNLSELATNSTLLDEYSRHRQERWDKFKRSKEVS